MYRTLDADRIVATIELLSRRIHERFPDSGLARVSEDLLCTARESKDLSIKVSRPLVTVRIAVAIIVATLVSTVVWAAVAWATQVTRFDWPGVVEAMESGFVMLGASVLFLVTAETRIKRNRALKAVHQLRVLAHVIDMHQLSKDPERFIFNDNRTKSSPVTTMTPFELARYLDYCSEMLSLIGKIAALYAQRFTDSVALDAVDSIESFTTGLSRKIWQKMMILNTMAAALESGRREAGGLS